MDTDSDAPGHLIWNYFKGLTSFDIVERDDGYINLSGGARDYFSEYKDWRRHEKEAITYAKGRCLDVGCGAGRVLLYLQLKGLRGLGMDLSPLAVKVCKLRGVKHAKTMGIDDTGRFKSDSFDSVIMFGNNFGLFGSKARARGLLKELYRITSSRGIIIAEDRDPYITKDPIHFRYHATNRKKGRMPGQLRIRIRFMQYATPWYDYLYVSKKEMLEILSGTGWRVKRFIDDEDYRKNGRYMAIMEKAT
ncbi:MAG: class I SAM-dependent methyltransferase [Candidatus Micrarchaeota archaeon]|nr:class I SAM-dependent methyltransferase [Candidatus Micrarchaeota archaeon]MDE1824650.1 class I SAM-dependent methyltransferase [Candidatus Micrarchaeota archaeon]MDE1849859.1 class I SAM-dependent methyltransferase [Candidatus Micrarchaeota archaeon]